MANVLALVIFAVLSGELVKAYPSDVDGVGGSKLTKLKLGRNIRVMHSCNSEHAIDHGDRLLIESPNFGTDKAYPESFSCGWTFRGTCKITLNCPRFWLTDLSCSDNVVVTGKEDSSTTFCGHRKPQNISSDNYMSIQFNTDRLKNLPGSGFQCEITCENEDKYTIEDRSIFNQLYSAMSGDNSCACGAPGSQRRIINGVDTEVYQYPWMVGLVTKGQDTPFCGGSLINNKYVLTAAHCVEAPTKAANIHLILNEYDTSMRDETNTIVLNAKRIIVHPGYTYYKSNDVALIEIDGELKLGVENDAAKIWNVCLPSDKLPSTDYAGKTVIATGWGKTANKGPLASKLQQVNLGVISNDDCDPHHAVITKEMLCAVAKDKDTCQGDSGGPLMYVAGKDNTFYTQVGITSSGSSKGCAKNVPGIYTRITEVLGWIKENSANGLSCTGDHQDFTTKLRNFNKFSIQTNGI
ncbi:unnamed protein product [Allacma fusca]|uniref:Uncharacterized protein n=1 Tax=Allacma fusca TaxID=39272 RepID=A0A8J2L1P7_9HEXA|nr:unnamed protein product [Allacma fusca]